MRTDLEKLVMAHRYRYYIMGRPVIGDLEYDCLEANARKFLPASSPVHHQGSDLESDYDEEIINLAKEMSGA